MSYKRMSIRERWDWLLKFFHNPTPEEMDEAARDAVRDELQYLYERTKKLEKLLAEPERLRNRKIAEQLAEEMHQRLEEKRRNPKPLTPEEQLHKDAWKAQCTPRSECKHLKGAEVSRWGVDKYGHRFGQARDYNVACHTFIDGRTKIWCLTGCGFVSWGGDENWAKAKEMVDLSTNRKSSSEYIPKTIEQ